jgi:hypothetical protein
MQATQAIAINNARHATKCRRVADENGLTGLQRDVFVEVCLTQPTFVSLTRRFDDAAAVAVALSGLMNAKLVFLSAMQANPRYIAIRID